MKRDRLTAQQIRDGQEEIKRMRTMLGAEMDLLIAETNQPRLLCYVAIQLAINAARAGSMTPGQFCALTSDVVGLMCGDDAGPIQLRKALEAGE